MRDLNKSDCSGLLRKRKAKAKLCAPVQSCADRTLFRFVPTAGEKERHSNQVLHKHRVPPWVRAQSAGLCLASTEGELGRQAI